MEAEVNGGETPVMDCRTTKRRRRHRKDSRNGNKLVSKAKRAAEFEIERTLFCQKSIKFVTPCCPVECRLSFVYKWHRHLELRLGRKIIVTFRSRR